jgi:hypothetical protein
MGIEKRIRRSRMPVMVGCAGVILMLFMMESDNARASSSIVSQCVTEAKAAVRIGLRPKLVQPGTPFEFRVENRSSTGVTYGLELVVQQQMPEGDWVRASFSPGGPWSQVLAKLRPGQIGNWQAPVDVPSDAVAGCYRIKKEVRVNGSRRFLATEFEIG